MAGKTMKFDLVQEMVTNYKTKQLESILTNTVNPMQFDAQSIWFDLESLTDFINTIQEEVAKHPEHKMDNLGIRFYYSAYPEAEKWEDEGYEDLADLLNNSTTQQYEKLHTLIGIPTVDIKGENSDFDPYDVDTYNGGKPAETGMAIMAKNHGSLTPPNAATGLWF